MQFSCNLVDTGMCESSKCYVLVSSTVGVLIVTPTLNIVYKINVDGEANFFMSAHMFNY